MKTTNEMLIDFFKKYPHVDADLMSVKANDPEHALQELKLAETCIDGMQVAMAENNLAEAVSLLKNWDDAHPDAPIQGTALNVVLNQFFLGTVQESTNKVLYFMDHAPEMFDRKIEVLERQGDKFGYHSQDSNDRIVEKRILDRVFAGYVDRHISASRKGAILQLTDEQLQFLIDVSKHPLTRDCQKEDRAYLAMTFYEANRLDAFEQLIQNGMDLDVPAPGSRTWRTLVYDMMAGAIHHENPLPFFEALPSSVPTADGDSQSPDAPHVVNVAMRLGNLDLLQWALDRPDLPTTWFDHDHIERALKMAENSRLTAKKDDPALPDYPKDEIRQKIHQKMDSIGHVIVDKYVPPSAAKPLDISMDSYF